MRGAAAGISPPRGEDPLVNNWYILFRFVLAKNVNFWFQFTWLLFHTTLTCYRELLIFATGLYFRFYYGNA